MTAALIVLACLAPSYLVVGLGHGIASRRSRPDWHGFNMAASLLAWPLLIIGGYFADLVRRRKAHRR